VHRISDADIDGAYSIFSDQLRLLTGRKPCFDHAISMPNQSVGSNDYPLGTTFPAPHLWDAPDPLPVMRREMKLLLIEISKLRVEVERLRGTEQEARYLSASLRRAEMSGGEKQNASARYSLKSHHGHCYGGAV
jgi:hypothetical protein